MASQVVRAGTVFIEAGSPLKGFWYISEGQASATYPGGSIMLGSGDIAGIADFDRDTHCFTYSAVTDITLSPFGTPEMLFRTNFLAERPTEMMLLIRAISRFAGAMADTYYQAAGRCNALVAFLNESYEKYEKLCEKARTVAKELPGLAELSDRPDADKEKAPGDWLPPFYKHQGALLADSSAVNSTFLPGMIPGMMNHAVSDIRRIREGAEAMAEYTDKVCGTLLNENSFDLFDLYTSLLFRVGLHNPCSEEIMAATDAIAEQMRLQPNIAQLTENRIARYHSMLDDHRKVQSASANDFSGDYSLPATLSDSLNTILEYGEVPEEVGNAFRKCLEDYQNLADKTDNSPEATEIRRALSDGFYKIYAMAFQVSLMEDEIPTVLKMFFNFGYVDPSVCGMSNAVDLYHLAEHFAGDPTHQVYTAYEWLCAIYSGKREPSVDEFDTDYEKNIANLVAEGRIPAKTGERMLQDRGQKVLYELGNLFPAAGKIVSGRPTTFCPVLSENQLMRNPGDCLLNPELALKSLEQILALDYTLFYRTRAVVVSERDKINDFYSIEVMPDIILMPVVGTRGAMWQEITGRSRMSSARWMLPVFHLDNISKSMLRLSAEYRWEMCKRLQGGRWNDVSDPSLTSLYCDLLQFYRKNGDIPANSKEKIRMALHKCKSNYKEYFVMDYMLYMLYESKGSPHLLKQSRAILLSQCPFPADVRESLSANPIYGELIAKANRPRAERLKRLEGLLKKMQAHGEKIPDGLVDEIEFTKR